MKKIILLVTVFALVAFVSGVMAQQKPAPAAPASTAAPAKPAMEKMEKFWGTIEKVDEMGKTVEVKGKKGKAMTFTFDDMTKITKGKEAMKAGDLKQGMMAGVEYKKEGDKMIATAIKLSAPKATPKKAAPAEAPAAK